MCLPTLPNSYIPKAAITQVESEKVSLQNRKPFISAGVDLNRRCELCDSYWYQTNWNTFLVIFGKPVLACGLGFL